MCVKSKSKKETIVLDSQNGDKRVDKNGNDLESDLRVVVPEFDETDHVPRILISSYRSFTCEFRFSEYIQF